MESKSPMYFCMVAFTTILVTLVNASNEQQFHFEVKPGGSTLSHKETWRGGTCEFTYACQGGTNEEWEMKMMRGQNGELVCHIMRPDGNSYLFFQHFEVKVTGYTLSSALVFSNDKTHIADQSEYFVDSKNGIVKSTSSFKAALNGIIVTSLPYRDDL